MTNQILTIKELLFTDKEAVDKEINAAINSITHKVLRDTAVHIFDAGGKRIRPSVLLTAYKALGGVDIESVLPVAAAVELVHNWSLVHDDIIDKSEVRRGLPTIHEKWDENVAILSGDMLNNLAYRLIATANISAKTANAINVELSNAIMELIDGELMDVEFESQEEVSEEAYFSMIGKKTGALLRVSAKIGSMLGTNDSDLIDAFEEYGQKIGIAFQIQDDLLDLIADGDTFGKEIGKDVKEGKKTFMVIHAINNAETSEANYLKQIINNSPASENDVKIAIEIMRKSGSLDYARQVLDELIEDATKAINKLPFSDHKNALLGLANFIANREY